MTLAARLAVLPPGARRGIALTMLAVAIAIVWGVFIIPVSMLVTSQAEWRADTVRNLGRDRGMVAAAGSIRDTAAAIDASGVRGWLYEAAGGIQPADALQNDLRTALLASGVEPTNFKVLPAVSTAGLRGQRVEFSTIVTIDQLQAFFLALERQPHYVRIERLRIDAPATQRSDENPRMTVLMEARGYSADNPRPELRVARAY